MGANLVSVFHEIFGYIFGLLVSVSVFVSPLIHVQMLLLVIFFKLKQNNKFINTTLRAVVISYIMYFIFINIMVSFLIYGKFML
ncbi:MAG: hypothetical protein LBV08_05550 [Clostridiales bacterium]|nr:hypothetical protein [Clostridiales bacterium]